MSKLVHPSKQDTTHINQQIVRTNRNNIEIQCQAIEEMGACIIKNALPSSQADTLAIRLREQASAEMKNSDHGGKFNCRLDSSWKKAWVSSHHNDPTQWVSMLPNKGRDFVKLTINPPMLNLAYKLIGKSCIVSEFSARITKPGSPALDLHSDQWWLPQPVNPYQQQRPVADIKREQIGKNSPKPTNKMIAPRVVLTVLYALENVTKEMGPTRLVPKSHLSGGLPQRGKKFATIAPELAKGDAIVFDGRLWHGSNPNRSDRDRLTLLILYTGPQFRQLTNYTFGLRPDVAAKLTDAERDVLGYRTWNSYGATEDYASIYATPGNFNTGELGIDNSMEILDECE